MNQTRDSQQASRAAEYHSATQLRLDRWTGLRGATLRLLRAHRAGRATAQLAQQVRRQIEALEPVETYFAFPGRLRFARLSNLLAEQEYALLHRMCDRITRALLSGSYRRDFQRQVALLEADDDADEEGEAEEDGRGRPWFEVLFVDLLSPRQEEALREALHAMRRPEDRFVYEPVVVPSFEDALIAVLFNPAIQAVVVRFGFPFHSKNRIELLLRYARQIGIDPDEVPPEEYGPELCRTIGRLRPELDSYLVTDQAVEDIAGRDLGSCRRIFYNQEDYVELHFNILRGINARYQTPFFDALRNYARQPTGVFHALPISRGKSIVKSQWIRDMGEFYGMNIFMAETSATSGGLDSLLEPVGPIKRAQELAARAFGARRTFFATNGTSTCNKIVVQALVQPGDIVLVDRDCHKSHHYGLVLAGAEVVYLESYPLEPWSMYGAVPLVEIKRRLLELRAAGKLDRVRMLLLTNCTFDGIVYNVERVMEECLAIKPDLVFLWDEAWFAFARFVPMYRQRTAMHVAEVLRQRYRTPEYRARFEAQQQELAGADDGTLLEARLLPDPDRVRIRVYATQSTHKTLTALRQGSMIHVYDQDFRGKVEEAFHEAFMTHTSTSPNYQIIASLDVGRRQVELEGYELVQKQIEAAMSIRCAIASHPLLQKYFRVLTVGDMIPAEFRSSGIESYFDAEHGWTDVAEAWAEDEFVLDATRITLLVGRTGFDGDTFKNRVLMDRFGIQINKTSRNTVLFMTNIGTTRSSVAYLIEVLVRIARELDEQLEDASAHERRGFERRVRALLDDVPPLPDFSGFHEAFRARDGTGTPEGDLRAAYFLAYDERNFEYVPIDDDSFEKALEAGRELVAATFVIPYPPGFPVLVPGQIVSPEIVTFLRKLDVREIHGYRRDLGLRVFTAEALRQRLRQPALAAE